ncbi:MAG: hypothetical protein V4596_11255 [Bdellovibrionota bacterium]
MNKLLASLIIISPFVVFGAPKVTKSTRTTLSEKDKASFGAIVSTFDITSEADGLKIDLRNINGQTKPEMLTTKVEDYEEYSKYSFDNPYLQNHRLDLFIFSRVKPNMLDDKDMANSIDDISDLRFDLQVLLDSASKKTIKSKVVVYYKDNIVAEGSVDNNSEIKIKDDLSNKVKNCKLQELKVIKNLLGSYKRSLDLEVKYVQSGRSVKQKLNLNLQNIKMTPKKIETETEENELEEQDLDLEGEENETSTTHS